MLSSRALVPVFRDYRRNSDLKRERKKIDGVLCRGDTSKPVRSLAAFQAGSCVLPHLQGFSRAEQGLSLWLEMDAVALWLSVACSMSVLRPLASRLSSGLVYFVGKGHLGSLDVAAEWLWSQELSGARPQLPERCSSLDMFKGNVFYVLTLKRG